MLLDFMYWWTENFDCAASIMCIIFISKNLFGTSYFFFRKVDVNQVWVCHAAHHVFVVFWIAICANDSLSTCAHTNTLLLDQRTLCKMHISQLFVVLLKFTISKSLVQDYGVPLVSTLYIHVLRILKHHAGMYFTKWNCIVHVNVFDKKS